MKKRILFVDDEPKILEGFRLMLFSRRKEWSAVFAESGEAALRHLEAGHFDAVVADMRMPGMDGAQLLSRIQESHPDTVRIILTGFSDADAAMRAVKPAHSFLMKPCSPELLQSVLDRAFATASILTNPRLRSVIAGIDSMPALPDIYLRIVEELAKPEPSLQAIGRLVEQDVAASATILKVINSAFFGLVNRVTNPSQAVALLGIDILQGLILGLHLFSKGSETPLPGMSVRLLWEHSLRVGYFAKNIALSEGHNTSIADYCFLAGLMHDVGKLILAQNFPEQYLKVLELVRQEDVAMFQAETEVFDVSHADAGAYLLGTWGLPEKVVCGVYCHHALRRLKTPDFHPALVVHVADAFEHELVVLNPEYNFATLDCPSLLRLGFFEKLGAWKTVCGDLRSQEEAR